MENTVYIQDLKKGDKFKFNHKIYTVKIKWRDDENKPLVTTCGELFHFEELEVLKLKEA